jgi:hypothetical protein
LIEVWQVQAVLLGRVTASDAFARFILKAAVEESPAGHSLQPQVFAAIAVVTHWVNYAAVENQDGSMS